MYGITSCAIVNIFCEYYLRMCRVTQRTREFVVFKCHKQNAQRRLGKYIYFDREHMGGKTLDQKYIFFVFFSTYLDFSSILQFFIVKVYTFTHIFAVQL